MEDVATIHEDAGDGGERLCETDHAHVVRIVMDHKILSKALKINLYSSYADLSHGERSALQKHYFCQWSLKYTHFRCMFF
jgi:hypothetical protein